MLWYVTILSTPHLDTLIKCDNIFLHFLVFLKQWKYEEFVHFNANVSEYDVVERLSQIEISNNDIWIKIMLYPNSSIKSRVTYSNNTKIMGGEWVIWGRELFFHLFLTQSFNSISLWKIHKTYSCVTYLGAWLIKYFIL